MYLLRRPSSRPSLLETGCVATIGAFDGLHLGHRRILGRVLELAERHNLPALIFSFEPTPKEYFARQSPPARLMRFRDKWTALEGLGLDVFFCPRFEPKLANLEPGVFIDELLLGLLNVKHLVVGDDFRFARKRAGTIEDLQRRGADCGFTVEQVGSVLLEGERVSSSVVRRLLEQGDMAHAAELLGAPYRMSGRVVPGQQLGRTLGMPTANVRLNRRLSPVQGIFAVRARCTGEAGWHDGVASIGTRPTVAGREPLLEVHLFDFSRDIYGEHIQVEFVAKLRDEERFDDLDALRDQMLIDARRAREILAAA